MVTMQTRRAAHEFVKPHKETRRQNILEALGKDSLTAREIALKMGFGEDMNKVRPRLTELEKMGRIEAVEDRLCPVTGRKVAVFRVVEL